MTHLYLIGPTPPHRGGIAHFNGRLLQALEGRAQVSPIGLARYPEWFRKDWLDKSRWSGLRHQAEPLLNGSRPSSWLELLRRLERDRPQKLVLHWAHPIATPMYWTIMQRARRIPGLSVELIVHNVLPHENRLLGGAISRLVFHQAHRFLVHSRSEAELLRRQVGERPISTAFHPIYDIFSGPDAPDLEAHARRLELRRPVLLFFGFIRPYKGLDILLRAMPRVLQSAPEATLVVAGELLGSNGTDPRPLVESLGIGRSVRLETRYIPNEEVAAHFRAADLVVLPYREASQSGALQVAYAFDRPVVASRVGGLEESVEEGRSGYLCEAGSSESLAAAILRALERPLPEEGVRSYGARFSWTRYVDLLLG